MVNFFYQYDREGEDGRTHADDDYASSEVVRKIESFREFATYNGKEQRASSFVARLTMHVFER
jgi:hypothetical protein